MSNTVSSAASSDLAVTVAEIYKVNALRSSYTFVLQSFALLIKNITMISIFLHHLSTSLDDFIR